MSDNTISPDQQNRDRSRKRKALLAGGLVLGIGAAATLAAFTDGEFANGTFSTGKFNIVGSADGTTWGDHAATDGQALTFSQTTNNLTPGDVVTAPFYIKTDNPSLAGNLAANAAAETGELAQYLETSVTYGHAGDTCSESFGGTPDPGSLDANGANTVMACLKVSVTGNQAELAALATPSAKIVWSWTATSA